jgi:hypothetical protein
MKNRIDYNNTNSMYNSGHINVYIDNKSVEYIFVDDFLEENKDAHCADDIIDLLKEKYNIQKVIRYEVNWR